jgi:hypothetical protein
MKYSKINMIQCFSKIIEDYLLNVSLFLSKNKNILNIDYILKKGINVIVHIFKLLMIQTKNLDSIFYLTSHAHNVYLEYIEQINKPPIMTDLNMIDAITFVVDKALSDSSIELDLTPIESPIIETLDILLDKCNVFFEGLTDIEGFTDIECQDVAKSSLKNTIEIYYHYVKRGDLIEALSVL